MRGSAPILEANFLYKGDECMKKTVGKLPVGRALVIARPWAELAGECAGRFFLSAVLAVGQVLGDYSPFALGFVSASGAGAGGFFSLLGCAFGYMLTKPLAQAFRYIAAAILIYAVAFAFYDLKVYATRFFMPICAAFLSALTGFVYLAEQGWAVTGVVCFLSETALVFWSGHCYARTRQRSEALFALGTVAVALHGIALPFSLSLGAVLAVGVVLWCARELDAQTTLTAALILGLCLDLGVGGEGAYTAAFGLGGLLARMGEEKSRPMAALAFAVGCLSVTLWSYSLTKSFLPLWNTLLGCTCFLAMPQGALNRLSGQFCPEEEGQAGGSRLAERRGERVISPVWDLEWVQERLRRQSAAFHAIYEHLSDETAPLKRNKTEGFALFQRCSRWVCQGCVFKSSCWKRDVEQTRKQLRCVVEGMEGRGRADPGDFPAGFSARCSRINELVNAVNREFAGELSRRRWNQRMEQERRGFYRQYESVARFLSAGAEALEPRAVPAMVGSTALSAIAGVAAGKRQGQGISGDAGGWFRDDAGILWVVLCDGMGSGPEAAKNSRFAYKLLEQFLSAGIGGEVAMATLAGALSLRWESTGSFTTVDLLELNLNTGAGAVYKLGAAPTYLRRDGVLTRITASTLPAGLQSAANADVTRFTLQPGDLAVLMSDGVTDGSEDGWIKEQIRGFQGDSPKDLAQLLLSREDHPRDDRTAIVLRIEGTQV